MKTTPSIIDIESSGFGCNSYPIEIGIVHSSGERFCVLIQPAANWTHWDCNAEKVHQISREQLKNTGLPIQDVAQMLNEQFRGQTLYSDGWVVDKPWISTLFNSAGVPMEFSVSPLELILNEAQMDCWHDVKEQVMTEKGLVRHRASNDAYIIQETFQRTARMVKKTGSKSLASLIQFDKVRCFFRPAGFNDNPLCTPRHNVYRFTVAGITSITEAKRV